MFQHTKKLWCVVLPGISNVITGVDDKSSASRGVPGGMGSNSFHAWSVA
jgi:hypothetical protein